MNFSEALSYVILAGTSFFCAQQIPLPASNHPMALIAYACTGLSAVLALLKAQMPESETLSKLEDFSAWTEFIETISFSLLVGNLWLNYDYEPYIGYAHVVVMLLLKFVGTDMLDMSVSKSVMLGYTLNEISCAYLGYIEDNQHALYATAAIFIASILHGAQHSFRTEITNYGLSSMFAMMFMATNHAVK